MQQANTPPAWAADDWPSDFDIRAEVAEQQELLERSDTSRDAHAGSFPIHSFEYDF